MKAIREYNPDKSLSPQPCFTFRANAKPVKYYVPERIKELGLPK